MTITLRYFAWLRERVGRAEEVLDVPPGVRTVGELMQWLKTRGPEYANAFERADVIRAAIDHTHVGREASITGAREVGFFPPVTGG
jgi:molybdopterin synthase sulfur carrier subunit